VRAARTHLGVDVGIAAARPAPRRPRCTSSTEDDDDIID
jgi:uncharacterized protein (DUF1499 family)